MEDYNYQLINEADEGTMEPLAFINRDEYCMDNNGMDYDFYEEAIILGTLKPDPKSPNSSTMGDILHEITELGKQFCCDQVAGTTVSPTSLQTQSVNALNYELSNQDVALDSTAIYIDEEENPANGNTVTNAVLNTNGDLTFQSELPYFDYPNSECMVFEESIVNQFFHTAEQEQQLIQYGTLMSPARAISIQSTDDSLEMLPMSSEVTLTNLDATQYVLSEKSAVVAPENYARVGSTSTSLLPSVCETEDRVYPENQNNITQEQLKIFENPSQISAMNFNNGEQNLFVGNQYILQQNPSNIELSFPTPNLKNNQFSCASVIQGNQMLQSQNIIVMRPLRTRKTLSIPCQPIKECTNIIDNEVMLSEYFDTSDIQIPMIQNRTSSICRVNRRKQKLGTMPGSENFIFEVQKIENDPIKFVPSVADYDPYPETDLPVVDEIFRRKKKYASLTTVAKKSQSVSEPLKETSLNKIKQLIESSTSFDEKISITSERKRGCSKIRINKDDLLFSSESDSDGSGDDAHDKNIQSKSLKCKKCKKIFKTTRSLAIHVKRCVTICYVTKRVTENALDSTKDTHDINNIYNTDINNNQDNINNTDNITNNNNTATANNTNTNNNINNTDDKTTGRNDTNNTKIDNEDHAVKLNEIFNNTKDQMDVTITVPKARRNARRLTRSQTKKSVGRSNGLPLKVKRFK